MNVYLFLLPGDDDQVDWREVARPSEMVGDEAQSSTPIRVVAGERQEVMTGEAEHKGPKFQAGIDRLVPLRKGKPIELAEAVATYKCILSLADRHPHLLDAMVALANGQPVTPEILTELKDAWLVRPDGTLPESYQAVLSAGCRETPEGGVIGPPIDFSSQETRVAFREQLKVSGRNLKRLARSLDSDDGTGQGRREK